MQYNGKNLKNHKGFEVGRKNNKRLATISGSGKSVETEESASRKQLAGGTKITRPLHAIVASKPFDMGVTGMILLQAVVLALEALPSVVPPGNTRPV
jgi:hypothetical protein